MPKRLNVCSWSKNPVARQLSNFAPSPCEVNFTREGLIALGFAESELPADPRIRVGSVEGFVQGLKEWRTRGQREIFLLSEKAAARAGRALQKDVDPPLRSIFIFGKPFAYFSVAHRALIEWALMAKFFGHQPSKDALLSTGDIELTHNLGKFDGAHGRTTLPKEVFVRQLRQIRDCLNARRHPLTLEELAAEIASDTHDEAGFYQGSL